MRTLLINKRPMWQVNCIGKVPILDEDGYDTGDVELKYSSPIPIELNMFVGDSDIIKNVFGNANNIDRIVSDERVVLEKGSKLFYEPPVNDEDITSKFDYEVTAISRSLNHITYGLRSVEY